MLHKIKSVEDGSIADQLGLKPGDTIAKINNELIVDFIDYQALCCQEKIALEAVHDGETVVYEFEKDEYEPLGLEFENDMLGKTRECVNHCRFCFVDQLPKGVRDSLTVKDDDWRLSLMMGNFVTLTNVSDHELNRIIARHAGPLYISVHATDKKVRDYLLRPRTNSDIMVQLKKLKDGGIQFHAQSVVCPGINDGEVMAKSIDDLASLWPACLSFALVPVGLTGHRDGLDDIRTFDKQSASALLDLVEKKRKEYKRKLGTNFVFPSDEMYIIAGRPLPSDEDYEDYAQIDNGVGLTRRMFTEFEEAYDDLPARYKKPGRTVKEICIACGESIEPLMRRLMDEHPVSGVSVRVCAVKNRYFGETVTVSGLITGRDLVDRMQGEKCDAILITECMLRSGQEVFLDDMTLAEAKKRLGVDVIPVGRLGDDLLNAILEFSDKR